MKRVLVLLAGVGLAGVASAGNIVQNGDFNDYLVDPVDSNGRYQVVDGGDIGMYIPDWTYVGAEGNNVALTSVNYLGQKEQEVDVSGLDNYPAGIGQELATTLQQYTLSFEIYTGDPINNYDGGVDVVVNDGAFGGANILTGQTQNLQGYQAGGTSAPYYDKKYTYTFTALSGETSLSFLMPLNQPSEPVSQVLDVRVTPGAVPEPFTLALGASALGLGIRRRLARKA